MTAHCVVFYVFHAVFMLYCILYVVVSCIVIISSGNEKLAEDLLVIDFQRVCCLS